MALLPELSYIIHRKNGGQRKYEYIVLRNLNGNLNNVNKGREIRGPCQDPLLWVQISDLLVGKSPIFRVPLIPSCTAPGCSSSF